MKTLLSLFLFVFLGLAFAQDETPDPSIPDAGVAPSSSDPAKEQHVGQGPAPGRICGDGSVVGGSGNKSSDRTDLEGDASTPAAGQK